MSEEKAKSAGLMHLNNVRTSHFYGHEPYTPPPSKDNPKPSPYFKSHFLLGPDHVDLKRVAAQIEEFGAALQWNGVVTWAQVKEPFKGKDANCLPAQGRRVEDPGAPEICRAVLHQRLEQAPLYDCQMPTASPLQAK